MLETIKPPWSLQNLLIIFLCIMVSMQIFMVLRFEMNWDEFLMLDWVYDWRANEMTLPFQTIYLRAFSWLPDVSDYEVTQIIIARSLMFLGVMIICSCLYSIAKRFFSTKAALIAVISYLSFSFVFRHATSFRMDTIVTTILMTVLWCLTRPKLTKYHIIYSGIAIGLSGMITIKAIFYMPTIGIILLVRWASTSWSKKAFLEGLFVTFMSLVSFSGFYLYHISSLPEGISGSSYLSSVVGGSVLDTGLFPSSFYIITAIIENIIYWILFILGVFFTTRHLGHNSKRLDSIMILSFMIPLLTLTFYLHGFPYYYTFMLAPVSILISAAVDGLLRANRKELVIVMLPFLAFTYTSVVKRSFSQTHDYQKQVINTVHQIFPEPVNFIDRCGMISSHNHVWFFMASWQMKEYYKTKLPNAELTLENNQPEYIIANLPSLDLDNLPNDDLHRPLLQRDASVLKENFIHHWGPIYVPGKKFTELNLVENFEILIEGDYTLEAYNPVTINNIHYQPGAHIQLSKGTYNISSSQKTNVILRWGQNLYLPIEAPKGQRLFNGF